MILRLFKFNEIDGLVLGITVWILLRPEQFPICLEKKRYRTTRESEIQVDKRRTLRVTRAFTHDYVIHTVRSLEAEISIIDTGKRPYSRGDYCNLKYMREKNERYNLKDTKSIETS